MRFIGITAVLIAAALWVHGCGKNLPESCDYVVTVGVQEADGADTLPTTGLKAYAFFVGPKAWTVASAGDAMKGVITEVGSGATRQADMAVEQTGDGAVTFVGVKGGSNLMLVVCDPARGIYAWRDDAVVPKGIGGIYVSLLFRPWKYATEEGGSYTEMRWNMVNTVDPDPQGPEDPANPENPEP